MKKTNKKIKVSNLYLALCSVLLTSCGHSNDNNSNTQLQQNKLKTASAGKDIPGIDLYSLNYDIRKDKQLKDPRTVCFENNAICVTQKTDVLGTYTLQQGKIAWIMPDSLGMFSVTLDPTKVKGGIRISSLYGKTNGNGVQGYITELDDRECDQDLAIGAKTCNIRYGYTGTEPYNYKTNTNHLILTWNDASGNKKTGDFTFDTFNVLSGVQNIPVINMIGSSEVNHLENLANEYNNDIYFMNSLNNQIILQNVGDKPLVKEADQPLFAIGRAQTNKSLNMDDLEFHNPDQPVTCKYNNRLDIKDTCNFNFDYTRKYETIDGKEVLSSQLGRLIFIHYPQQDEPRVNYTQKFVLSAGHIIPQNITKDLNGTFELHLANIHSKPTPTDPAMMSYQLPKTSVKLSIEYNPGFYVPHVERSDTIYYGVGEEDKNLVSTFKLTETKNTSGNFSANDGNLGYSTLGYKVTSTIHEDDFPKSAPLGGLLVATYWSPVANREVRQIVGTITVRTLGNDGFQRINNLDPKVFGKTFNLSYLKILLNESPYCRDGEYNPHIQIMRAKCKSGNEFGNLFFQTSLDVTKCPKDKYGQYYITIFENYDYTSLVCK
ncbi:MAG: hypothetical protein PHC75_10445 [Burkholderiales bacterium]|nr:hypothetical protein [Burkholderiales bacterium]